MPDIDRFRRCRIQSGLPHFLECVGAGLLKNRQGGVKRQAGGCFVDFHHARFGAIGKREGSLQVVGPPPRPPGQN